MARRTILNTLIDEKHQQHFIEPENQDKRESLGCLVAEQCEFIGDDIAVAFLAALEDANYHEAFKDIREYFLNKGYNLDSDPLYRFNNDED
jgi:hypothetical protein